MSEKEFILNILQIVVPFGAALIAFWLGGVSANRNLKHEAERLRIENFYLPYIRFYFSGLLWKIKFSTLQIESCGKFFDLVMKNFHYTSPKIQQMIPEFYMAYLNIMEFRDGNSDYVNAPAEIDEVFYRLSRVALEEYKILCRKLKLETPTTPPLPQDFQQ